MQTNKSLFNLYKNAANYINGKGTFSQYDIIEVACRVLPNDVFGSLYEKCCAHINGWNEKPFGEQMADGYGLIEEISAELGSYFE